MANRLYQCQSVCQFGSLAVAWTFACSCLSNKLACCLLQPNQVCMSIFNMSLGVDYTLRYFSTIGPLPNPGNLLRSLLSRRGERRGTHWDLGLILILTLFFLGIASDHFGLLLTNQKILWPPTTQFIPLNHYLCSLPIKHRLWPSDLRTNVRSLGSLYLFRAT